MTAELFEKLTKAIIEGNSKEAVRLTEEAIEKKVPANSILQEALIPGIKTVGELFSKGEYFLPELMVSGKAMSGAVEKIAPLLSEAAGTQTGRYLIGTVKGDIHDIGKNIVIMMLKANGWEVTDLGVDVPPAKVCGAIQTGNYDIFGMSTLLTVTMPSAAETIDAIKDAGLRDKVKIMIGGAPVTQEFADRIGADEYARDAWEAVTKAKNLLEKR